MGATVLLLTGHVSHAVAAVVCYGADGHVAVEVAAEDCCVVDGIGAPDDDITRIADDTGCGACTDVELQKPWVGPRTAGPSPPALEAARTPISGSCLGGVPAAHPPIDSGGDGAWRTTLAPLAAVVLRT